MTLALYGKSRRRQLLLVGLAVLVTTLALLAGLGGENSSRAASGDTGWKSPALDGSSTLNTANANNGFTNGERAKAADTTFATIRVEWNQHSYGSFGLTIPPDAVVGGIEVGVDFWHRLAAENNCSLQVRLWRDSKGGSARWTGPKALAGAGDSHTDTYLIAGGPTDLWGESAWANADFANTPFLVDLQYVDHGSKCTSTTSSGGLAIDHLQVRVHYSTPDATPLPDLQVTKRATRNGQEVSSIADNEEFRWAWTITNAGEGDAVFEAGNEVLRDQLPAGMSYSGIGHSQGGLLSCAIASDVIVCTALGPITVPPAGTVSISVNADPGSHGTYTNTATGCQVDVLNGNTAGNVAESDETNNACSTSVSVEVLERFHSRLCIRLVDNGDDVLGQTAKFFFTIENVTTGSGTNAGTPTRTETDVNAPINASVECGDLSYVPVGTVLRATFGLIEPVDATVAPGYPIAQLWPGIDPTPPSSVVEFTVGDGNCGGPTNDEAVIANGTCNLYLFYKLAPASPPVQPPTVHKGAAAIAVADGKAFWDITIDQPAENAAPQTVVITDAHSDIELVNAPACSLNGAVITCDVTESDLTITVARPISGQTLASGTLCAGGTVANHLLSASAAGTPLTITAGGSPVAIDVRDTSACAPPTITKMLVPGGAATVEDPADVRWQITVSNPADGLNGVTVAVRDASAALVAGGATTDPAGNLTNWCEVIAAPFEVTCDLAAGGTATFIVSPVIAPALQCEDQQFENTAEFRVGTGAWQVKSGPAITLLGSEAECPQDITIVKRLVNLPEGFTIDPATDLPSFAVPGGTYVSGPTPNGNGQYAWVYTVPPRYEGIIVESVPSGWEPVACEAEPGAYATFCNQPLAKVAVRKMFIPNGGPDATADDLPLAITLEGHGQFAPGPVVDNRSDYSSKRVSAGQFTITETLNNGWHLRDVTVSGAGCEEVVPGNLLEALEAQLVRVIHLLHRETAVSFVAEPGADCLVTFENERLVATVVVEKVYVGAGGDAPQLTLEVDGSAVAGSWSASGAPEDRWTRVVSVAAAGSSATVTETLPAGWANAGASIGSCAGVATDGSPVAGSTASVTLADIAPGDTATVCFVNVAVGQVQLLKLDSHQSGAGQTWSFVSTAGPLNGESLATADAAGTTQAQSSFTLVPAGSYTIAEEQGRGECIPGATASQFQTEAAASVGEPPADGDMTLIGANALLFTVEKGQTTYIRFDNRGCGTVLGTGLIVVWKFADMDGDGERDPGDAPVAAHGFHISGPDGEFDVVTDSEGKHVFTVAQGGAYTISEEPADGWRAIGSVQGGTLTAGAVATVAAGLGEHREVTFFNQPRVNILVVKTETTMEAPAGRPGDGWTFTLTGCGVEPRVATTGADGTLLFNDLPPAVGCVYSVTETEVAGWLAVTPSRTAAPTSPGETVTLGFRNIRLEGCVADCGTTTPGATPTPTVAGSTPTPTPTAPTDMSPPGNTPTPAATVVPGGPTSTATEPPITAVAGERTRGPGATPIAPSTGYGPGDGTGGGLVMWLAGSVALLAGLAILRLSRRN